MPEAPTYEADVIDSISDGPVDPRCDAACKKVLSCKEFAAPILKYVCTEYEGMETANIIALFDSAAQSEHPLIRMLSLIFTQELTAGQKKELLENNYNIKMTENVE